MSAATRNGVTLTCVTLNAPDDWNDHIAMLNYGFSKAKHKTAVYAGDYSISCATENAEKPYVKLYFKSDLSYVQIEGNENKTEIKYRINQKIKPHTKRGTTVGKAILYCDEKECSSTDLVCGEDIVPSQRVRFDEKYRSLLKKYIYAS